MIKSMTGFGRGEASDGDRKITIEMKSVNHRYFEPSIKMPKKLNFYEAGIRTELKKYINRGKESIFIRKNRSIRPRGLPCWNAARDMKPHSNS